VAGSLAIRETEITKEIDVRYVGAVCLCCGNKEDTRTTPIRHFFPAERDMRFRGSQEVECGVPIAHLDTTAKQNQTTGDRLSVVRD
jgi:hypothetical protein